MIQPDLAAGRKDYDPWQNRRDYSSLWRAHSKDQHYDRRLPERLKSAATYTIQTTAADSSKIDQTKPGFSELHLSNLEDEFGRTLKQPINLTFYTDHRLPNFKLAHQTAVLESRVDSEVPLYVTNLDKITFNYKILTKEGKKT